MTTIRFMPPRVPLVDPQTGIISREWYQLFLNIMSPMVGEESDAMSLSYQSGTSAELAALLSTTAADISQLPAASDFSQGIETLRQELNVSPIQQLAMAINDLSAEMSGIRDQQAEILKAINDIRQGTFL